MLLKLLGDWIWKILGNIADFLILILSFQDGDLEGKNKKDSESEDANEADGLLTKTALNKFRAQQPPSAIGLPRPHEGESTRRLRRNSANIPDASKKRKTVERTEVDGKFGLASRSTSRDDPPPNAPGIALAALQQFSSDPDAGIGLRGSKPLISLDRLSILSVPPSDDISNNKTLPTFVTATSNTASKKAAIPYNALDLTLGTLSTTTTSTRPSYSLPFIKFSDIVLAECIGNGGFGQVWKGNWKGTPVAVKMISHGGWTPKLDIQQQYHAVPEKLIKGFEEEVNLLGKLRHPNICLLLGICIEANAHIMVTELVCRGSLWDQLRVPNLFKIQHEDRFFWPNWVITRVLEGTGRGLSYLHSCDPPIIHRDLKSANILLDESFNVKICDFGLAKLRDLTTVMTANVGTVQWMAPEVLQGHEYFESADIYSLGLVTWELLTGQCPYEGMKQMEIALNVVNYNVRPTIPSTCTAEQYQFIQECWATNPFDRISAETFVNKVPHIFAH